MECRNICATILPEETSVTWAKGKLVSLKKYPLEYTNNKSRYITVAEGSSVMQLTDRGAAVSKP
jgi:hypothetical protein